MDPVQSPDTANLRRRRWLLGLGLPLAAGLGALAYLESSRIPATVPAGALPLVMRAQPIPLPELRVLDGAGRPVELASLKGKVVLLNIWATWCPPCRQEMPSLDRLQALLGGADFQVVALSMDTGAKGLERSSPSMLQRGSGISPSTRTPKPTQSSSSRRLGFPRPCCWTGRAARSAA